MSMAQGFAQGFGMMNNFMQQQDAKEQQAAQTTENNRRYQESIDWRNTTHAEQKKEQEESSKIAAEDRLINNGLKGVMISNTSMTAEQQANMRYEQEQQAKARALAIKESNAAAYYNATNARANKTMLDSRIAGYNFNNTQAQDGFKNLLAYNDASGLNDPQREYLRGLKKREPELAAVSSDFNAFNQAMASEKDQGKRGEITNQLIARTSSPEWRNVLNSRFIPSFSERMQADPSIESIGAAGLAPIGNGAAILMDIKYKDGTIKRNVPATKNKTGDANDEIVVLPWGTLVNELQQPYQLADAAKKAVQTNPALGYQVYGMKPGQEIKKPGYSAFSGEAFAGGFSPTGSGSKNNDTLTASQKANLIQREIESLRKSGAYNENAIARINQLQKDYDAIMYSSDAKTQPQQQQPVQQQPTSVQPATPDFMSSDFINYHFPTKQKQ